MPDSLYTVELAYADDGSLDRDEELKYIAADHHAEGQVPYAGFGGGSRDIAFDFNSRDDALAFTRKMHRTPDVDVTFVKRYSLPIPDDDTEPVYLEGFLSEDTPLDDPDLTLFRAVRDA